VEDAAVIQTVPAPGRTGHKRVLVVEDERDIAELIKHALERSGEIRADIVGTGAAALTAVTDDPPDLILLDLSLPLLDGLELFRILRHRPATASIPIIMLTARASESDRVTGIELGAEDYITKPFSPRELVARARAAMRRSRGPAAPAGPAPYRGRHLFVDFDAVSIRVDNASVTLTRREFELLRFLIENRNRVISRDRLLERVWGFDLEIETRSVDVHVSRLRAKLGTAGKQIETVIGMGYRFSDIAEN
jgi:two-component system alkaline phosphatase synthesis response regulator PhoP